MADPVHSVSAAAPPSLLTRLRERSAEKVLEKLSKVALMRELPPEEVQAVVPFFESRFLRAGTIVVRAGEPDLSLYLVVDGELDVLAEDEPGFTAGQRLRTLGPGTAFGEVALLTGAPRQTTVRAGADAELLRLSKEDFDRIVAVSPALSARVHELAEQHLRLGTLVQDDSRLEQEQPTRERAWKAIALHALEARKRGFAAWQLVMGVGLLSWLVLRTGEATGLVPVEEGGLSIGAANLLIGLAVLQGACEAFVLGVERLGARQQWDGFTCGTIGSLVATLPEFVVIAFLVSVEPEAAFVTSLVTIYNNALAFSIYSFFLPKDVKGQFLMPDSLSRAGAEVLVAGSGIAMIVGGLMMVLRAATEKTALVGSDLALIGVALIVIYGYYTHSLVRYYSEREAGAPRPCA